MQEWHEKLIFIAIPAFWCRNCIKILNFFKFNCSFWGTSSPRRSDPLDPTGWLDPTGGQAPRPPYRLALTRSPSTKTSKNSKAPQTSELKSAHGTATVRLLGLVLSSRFGNFTSFCYN